MNLLLFDGSHLAFRAFCAFPALTIDDFPVGAIYGVLKILTSFVSEWSPGKIIIPFDVSKSKYRLNLYPEYKAGREDSKSKTLREGFGLQLPIIHELLSKFGITTITEESRGIEADDVIAYLVHQYRAGKFPNITRVVIISSDKDLCQLVGPDKVVWYDPIKKNLINADNFEQEFGIRIDQYPDFKVLKGDTSDNIPHPRGLGPNTAIKLLREYETLNHMLEIKHSKIEPYREVVSLARKLVALNLHEIEKESLIWSTIDQKIHQKVEIAPDLEEVLNSLGFASILENWEQIKPRWQEFNNITL